MDQQLNNKIASFNLLRIGLVKTKDFNDSKLFLLNPKSSELNVVSKRI
jgi:hypothetical protein